MKFVTTLALFLFSAAVSAQTVPARVTSTSLIHATVDPTVAEASDFTAVADSSGSLSATAFRFYSAADAKCYEVWYDVDSGSSAPVAHTGCTLVKVDIATDDTNATVAGNTRTVLNAAPYTTYFAITGATTHVIVTSLTKGVATDGNVGTSGFSVSKTQGVSSAAAIGSSDIASNVVGFKICVDAVQTSTWLAVGKNTLDTELDGVRLGKGKCFDCPDCRQDILSSLRVSGQASSTGYTIVQYKK